MIRYTLACEAGHGFESWFPSSDSYDDQVARGFVTCPVCGSARVGKGMMAPAIARSGREAEAPAVATPPQPAEVVPQLATTEPEQRLRALMQALRAEATKGADDVGPRFPEEARRMHYGEAETRAIYGQASLDEARELLDEGIAVAPLPPAPDERH